MTPADVASAAADAAAALEAVKADTAPAIADLAGAVLLARAMERIAGDLGEALLEVAAAALFPEPEPEPTLDRARIEDALRDLGASFTPNPQWKAQVLERLRSAAPARACDPSCQCSCHSKPEGAL